MIQKIRQYRPKPLKKRMFELLAILTVSILSVSIYTAWDYRKLQISVIEENNRLYATQLAKSTRQTYEIYKNICYSVAFNQSLQEFITETDSVRKYELYQEQQIYLSSMANLDSYIVDIAILGDTGNSISLTGAVQSYQVLAKQLPSRRFSFCSMGLLRVNGIDCHILAMPVHVLSSDSSYLGVLFLAIDISRYFENGIPQDTRYRPSILLASASGHELIYGSESLYQEIRKAGINADSFSLEEGNKTYAVNCYSLPSIDFSLYTLVDKSQYFTEIIQLVGRHFLWVGLTLLLVAVLLLSFLRPLISSLNR
ncbi:MAG: hypothetical protein SOZ59_05780, partial [Candidatus Limivivens sp.]|nr:hypothetical protein [Candidatus Limivivens sp.]